MKDLNIHATDIPGCYLIEPEIHADHRGFFMEWFNRTQFERFLGGPISFVQDNISKSERHVMRGLHYQVNPYAQAKLVGVIRGCVRDVVVDLRPESAAFGRHMVVELSDSNRRQLFIPRGLAHGFLSLEPDTLLSYKCDNYYNPKAEAGIRFNDSDLKIDWGLPESEMIISGKDLHWPAFKEVFP